MRLFILILISAFSFFSSADPISPPTKNNFKSIKGQELNVARFMAQTIIRRLIFSSDCSVAFVSSTQVLTAAHCFDFENPYKVEVITDDGQRLTVTDVLWYKKADGYPVFDKKFAIDQNFDFSLHDMALLTVSGGRQKTFYEIYPGDPKGLIGKNVKLIGYPIDYIKSQDPYDNTHKFSTGSVCKIIDYYNEVLYSNCVPLDGISGGPAIYTDDNGKEWLIGVISAVSSSEKRQGSKISPVFSKDWVTKSLKK